MNMAEHRIVNLLKTLWHFFVITCRNVFNVWPKTTLLPVWPRDAKRPDTPGRWLCGSNAFFSTSSHCEGSTFPLVSLCHHGAAPCVGQSLHQTSAGWGRGLSFGSPEPCRAGALPWEVIENKLCLAPLKYLFHPVAVKVVIPLWPHVSNVITKERKTVRLED